MTPTDDTTSTADGEAVAVEAYAGGSYPGHPRAVVWRGRRYTVEAVERQWRTPEALFFSIRCQNGPRLRLRYDARHDHWRAAISTATSSAPLQDGRDIRSPLSSNDPSSTQENPA